MKSGNGRKDGKLPSLLKFCVLVGFYMDFDAGARLLENLDKLGIRSFWIDSRVEGFPKLSNDPEDRSNDGLRELIHASEFATLIDTPAKPEPAGYWMSKCFKQLGEEYQFIMVMGCDEYITGDIRLLMKNLDRLKLDRPAKLEFQL